MIDVYLDCPSPTPGGPVNSECGETKTITWSSAGQISTYFYVQNVNEQLISFDFTNVTNNGSIVTVDVIYPRDGVTITAQTFSLGVITSNTKKYHFLDFGTTQQNDGNIILKFTITGGSTGSIDITLDCSVLVGSRLMCYQILKSAPRDLCTKCTNPVRVYFERTSFFSNNTFSYGTWYSDPELQNVAPSGYYSISDQGSPKTVWIFTGGVPSVNRYCDPSQLACGNSSTQTNLLSGYTSNTPYLPNTPYTQLSGLKYSIKEFFVELDTQQNGYIQLTISNTQTYQKEVYVTISDNNAPVGEVGALSYSEVNPSVAEYFKTLTVLNLIPIPKNSSKTIWVLVNGNQNKPTKTLRVRVAVGLDKNFTNSSTTPVDVSLSTTCITPIFSADTGLHVYSAYDAANSPKCTTTLYSLTNPTSWGVNTKVWHDGFFTNPALPYYYAYGSKVFKVGQPFRREFGTKTRYVIKSSNIKKLAKFLGLSKKNPTTVTPEVLGPKDWQTPTQVPACIEPTMQGIGIIKQQLDVATLPVPTSYLYLVGKNASSKIAANDSVFTEYDFQNGVHKPITGLMHALYKIPNAYVKSSSSAEVRGAIGSNLGAYAALGLGALASAIVVAPTVFGLASAASLSVFYSTACAGLFPVLVGLSSTGVGVLVAILVLALVLLFLPVKKTIEEDCKMFDKVYTNNEYLELSNTIFTNSGLTTNGITGFYTDGAYFYTTTNGTISGKELSYTNIDGARKYSLEPDNPTYITSIVSFYFLPYVSGRPMGYTTPKFVNQALSTTATPTTKTGDLNNALDITYEVPVGLFEADTQAEADTLAQNYLTSLTANTVDIYISTQEKPGVSGNTFTFTHEIKVEQTPAVWPVFYDDSDNLGVTVGKKLYYDSDGLYSVLNGYYSLGNVGGNYRTFYKTSGGTVVDFYNMATSSSTTVTSPNSGSLPVITTGQTFTSSWYFYGESLVDVGYDDTNNLHGFTDTWNTSTFYSSEYVKRGMINSPITKNTIYIYDNNTSSFAFTNGAEGWYKEIPNIFNEEAFLIQSAFTVYLNSVQYCSDDSDNGIYVTCVDVSGNTIPSFYGVSGYLNVTTSSGTTSYNFTIESDDYRVLVPLGQEFINSIISADVTVTSINPINNITFVDGAFIPCTTPTPTPTPEFSPEVSETPTPTPTTTPTSTPTPTPSVTPTQTPTQTVTPSQTKTPTQTVTPSQTKTPTPTQTPTSTPPNTPTQTSTQTPTPTTTPTKTPIGSFTLRMGTTDCMEVCQGGGKLQNVYSPCATLEEFCYVYANPGLTIPLDSKFLSDGTYCYQTAPNGMIESKTICPSQTPTPTQTPTQTITPTVTRTQTPTQTPTQTQTPTNTPSETQAPPTPTSTETPTPTPTSTETPTPTPTEQAPTYYYYFVTQYLDCIQNSAPGQFCVRTTFLVSNWICGTDTNVYGFESNATEFDWINSPYQIESTTSLVSCNESCV